MSFLITALYCSGDSECADPRIDYKGTCSSVAGVGCSRDGYLTAYCGEKTGYFTIIVVGSFRPCDSVEGNDWSVTYSVGDEYNPSEKTDGIVAEDVKITGEGTYTVSLDFTKTAAGYADSTVFCALGISNGELLYPGYIIEVVDLQINGESYPLVAEPYTTTDDKKCTRLNIYNACVKSIPAEARTADGDLSTVAPCIVDNEELGNITSISLTFEYKPGQ